MSKVKQNRWGRGLGMGSGALLTLLLLMMICPSVAEPTEAAQNTTAVTETRISVQAGATIALGMTNAVNIDVKPTADGTFEAATAEISVTTNHEAGYTVFLKTGDGTSLLKNQSDTTLTGENYEIASIVDESTKSQFTGNTWGYNLTKGTVEATDTTVYSAVPAKEMQIVKQEQASTGVADKYSLTFGAHATANLVAGTYSNSVIVSAVANPTTITRLDQAFYMQDVTADLCNKAAEGQHKALIDTRDGKKYEVAVMKDGKCWMNQNLALTFGEGTSKVKTLEPTQSDVATSWTPPATTMSTPTGKGSDDPAGMSSWDLGQIVLKNPTGSQNCPQPTPPAGYNGDGYNSVYPGQTLEGNCPQYFQNVENLQEGFEATTTSSISEDGTQYDAHYLIGNYYQWNTATAGTGSNVGASGNALSSICPKNWTLPTNAQYVALTKAYGYSGENNQAITASTSRIDYKPLYFVRSGNVSLPGGALRRGGGSSSCWSVSASSDINGYYILFDTSVLSPSYSSNRWIGFPVRCVSR